MTKLYNFNYVVYKGNVNRKFYLYCLKKQPKLMKYVFVNILNFIISLIILSKRKLYIKNKFKYLEEVNDLLKVIDEFYDKDDRYNNYIELGKNDIIIDKVPNILIKVENVKKIIGFELDQNYEVNLDKYNNEIGKIEKVDSLLIRNIFQLYNIETNKIFVIRNNRIRYLKKRIRRIKKLERFILISLLSFILTCVSFCYTSYVFDMSMFLSYFEIKLFLLNYIPIMLFIYLLYYITKDFKISFLINSILIILLGISNQTKLLYRDDVVKFEDLTVFKEAMTISQRYDVVIRWYTILVIIVLIIIFLMIRAFVNKSKINIKRQLVGIFTIILMFICSYKLLFSNNDVYDSVGDKDLINIWMATRQSQIRGLVYPFVDSISEVTIKKPKNYSKSVAVKLLNDYEYKNIPDDKKVNVIAVMLEAYNDFSKYDNIDIDPSVYEKLHDIQNKSLSGNLVTTIFGGGTIVTERNFLTGYYSLPNFRKDTNSYVWYFKEQGYRTDAMHPMHGTFYNRTSANINLGFDNYYNYDNKFSSINREFLKDNEFFDYIIEEYEKSKYDDIPYFNFSVTYQNHGPYSDLEYDDKEYVVKDIGYDVSTYNTFNEYLSGIKSTNDALEKLINYFDDEEDPVIIVFFGDHNPYLGENGYDDLNIYLDLSTVEGFENYYETPFVIHANDSAKLMFDKDFIGHGDKISPIFLMNEIFDYCGLEGNEYMQYMSDLKENIDVINKYYYKEKGKFIRTKEIENRNLIDEYNSVNYYYSRNFKEVIK